MMNIREKIHAGSLVKYQGKQYVVSGRWFDCGGNSMIVDLVRPTESGISFRFIKHIYDEQIENCKIIKEIVCNNKGDITQCGLP